MQAHKLELLPFCNAFASLLENENPFHAADLVHNSFVVHVTNSNSTQKLHIFPLQWAFSREVQQQRDTVSHKNIKKLHPLWPDNPDMHATKSSIVCNVFCCCCLQKQSSETCKSEAKLHHRISFISNFVRGVSYVVTKSH